MPERGLLVWCTIQSAMTQDQQDLLLTAARESVTAAVQGAPDPPPIGELTNVEHGGVFVTLRQAGKLRGCMGTFASEPNLLVAVQNAAASTARDPRFAAKPITSAELAELDMEVSILSKPWQTAEPLSLELGTHGILIEHPQGRGCFLPHVAEEFGWTKEEFLRRCCSDKAQLDPDAWQRPETVISLFTADVFSDRGDRRKTP